MKKNTEKPESLFLNNENICMAIDLYQLTIEYPVTISKRLKRIRDKISVGAR
ncbi:MAG: hypothetical protein NUV86_07605 [Candidatus Scalindua sp.]|nr:hypothetical protein [Candidatus Scalindua sp.]MCR4344371.1 hypothetical protein [Candidatus Scalindua sp.]